MRIECTMYNEAVGFVKSEQIKNFIVNYVGSKVVVLYYYYYYYNNQSIMQYVLLSSLELLWLATTKKFVAGNYFYLYCLLNIWF